MQWLFDKVLIACLVQIRNEENKAKEVVNKDFLKNIKEEYEKKIGAIKIKHQIELENGIMNICLTYTF